MSLRQRLIQAALVVGLSGAAGTGALITSAEFIGNKEGERREVYLDLGGVPTWCFGQTVGTYKARYTAQECAEDLLRSTRQYHTSVMRYLPQSAPESVQAAMTSLAYNVGMYGWQWELRGGKRVPSRFMPYIQRADWEGLCAAIEAPWVGRHGVAKGFKATVQGRPVRGLENRRAGEAKLCRRDLHVR